MTVTVTKVEAGKVLSTQNSTPKSQPSKPPSYTVLNSQRASSASSSPVTEAMPAGDEKLQHAATNVPFGVLPVLQEPSANPRIVQQFRGQYIELLQRDFYPRHRQFRVNNRTDAAAGSAWSQVKGWIVESLAETTDCEPVFNMLPPKDVRMPHIPSAKSRNSIRIRRARSESR